MSDPEDVRQDASASIQIIAGDEDLKGRYANLMSVSHTGEEFVLGHLTASRTGGEAPTSIDDAVHVLEVIDAALESSATGRTIKIAGA